MAQDINVIPADEGKAYKQFLEIPYMIQKSDPNWVPPIRMQVKELLNPKKNPFFDHAELKKFIALDNGKPIGRIAAVKDRSHLDIHKDDTGMFGFFECFDNETAAKALFDVAEETARNWNLKHIRGPFNPSVNEDIGTLVDGFDTPPTIMMPHNPSFYPKLIEKCGFEKEMDLYCYYIDHSLMTEKLKRAAEKIRQRTKLKYRKLDGKNLEKDAFKIWDVYSKAWENNWCAVPLTSDEFQHLVDNLKQYADPDIIFLAEDEDDKLVGFSLALPNLNEAIIKIRDGRLFPVGLPKLLWNTRKGAIKSARILIMGVLEEYRGKGVDAVFYYDHFKVAEENGLEWGEMSWILETNTMMNRAAEMMGGKVYKTYRVYKKEL